jgi:hypothetical protein
MRHPMLSFFSARGFSRRQHTFDGSFKDIQFESGQCLIYWSESLGGWAGSFYFY